MMRTASAFYAFAVTAPAAWVTAHAGERGSAHTTFIYDRGQDTVEVLLRNRGRKVSIVRLDGDALRGGTT